MTPIKNTKDNKISYEDVKEKLNKYLITAYQQYCKDTFVPLDAFENNNDRKSMIDLRIFLKFYKDFQLNTVMKVSIITKLFKK